MPGHFCADGGSRPAKRSTPWWSLQKWPRSRWSRGKARTFANFPKSNELYLGAKIGPLLKEMDLVLLVDSWAPWYPPSNKPKYAQIVSISENPLKGNMVYQTMEANHYLEGNIAVTLQLLTEALRKLGLDAAKLAERRTRWQAEHKKWRAGVAAAEEQGCGKRCRSPSRC